VKTTDRLYIIDLLRFLAAFSVMLYHLMFRCYVDHESVLRFAESEGVVRYMTLAVQLFFMISGFVICWSTEGKRPLQFVWSRFVRLFPTYWLCVTITFVICQLWGNADMKVSFMDYLKNLTMLQPHLKAVLVDWPYWTLFEELRFYALILACLVIGYRNWLVVAACWVGLSALDFSMQYLCMKHLPVVHYELALQYAPFFAGGMVYYQMYKQGPNWKQVAILVVCWAVGCLWFNESAHHDVKTQLSGGVSACVIAGIFGVFGLVATRKLSLQKNYRIVTIMGGVTYPLYLLHDRVGAIFLTANAGSMSRWLVLGLFIIISNLAAWAVWRFFEGPVAKWLHRHKPSWIDSASTVVQDVALATKRHV
jgi:peptidoglycan/LPS O-acetylase OafA/YrhL